MTPATSPTAPETARGTGGAELTLAPTSLEAFLAGHFDRRPLLVRRSEPQRFDGLLTTAALEEIVLARGLRTPGFRLVRDGAQLPVGEYAEDIPWRPGAFTGTPVAERVAEAFAAGATLVVQALQLHWPPVARYCRELEAALGCPVQANAYWTPPAARGFDVHHDTHDVFVLQLAGTKRWRVHEPVLEAPLPAQKWSAALGDAGPPVMEFELAAGDTLYLPRGWPHAAETAARESLHLTVGVHPPTRLDALRAALDACADDVEFRRALRPGDDLGEALLHRLAERLAPEAVAARARRRFLDGRRAIQPDQITQLRALDGLDEHTPVQRRATVIADLDGRVLRFEGKEIAWPAHALEALAAVHAAAGPFTAADLPGPLDVPGRLVLLRRLVREGYLQIVAAG